eukprot:gnl/Trimastix_PCT/2546.p1 GENE.gnl/Trimastix_PCT/2546~~gnl/Trimastix_PCT/2546.p1  ORF type:complete len:423 (-),score=97.31 gnl/Trimastix_PCT/2546:67-1335(-)
MTPLSRFPLLLLFVVNLLFSAYFWNHPRRRRFYLGTLLLIPLLVRDFSAYLRSIWVTRFFLVMEGITVLRVLLLMYFPSTTRTLLVACFIIGPAAVFTMWVWLSSPILFASIGFRRLVAPWVKWPKPFHVKLAFLFAYGIVALGVLVSIYHSTITPPLQEVPIEVASINTARRDNATLRVLQISDVHLSVWTPPHRLRRILEAGVAQRPDLVVFTGDMFSTDVHPTRDLQVLVDALAPLRKLPKGRCFAILGNHDIQPERRAYMEGACAASNMRLLDDEEVVLQLAGMQIQLVGLTYRSAPQVIRAQVAMLQSEFALERHPGTDLRLVLIHNPLDVLHASREDPGVFLMGHTHGGQPWVYALGYLVTSIQHVIRTPFDRGLHRLGKNTLYVHAGNGNMDIPMRILQPSEQSVLDIHVRARAK